jgi:hypothetical protein
MSKKTLLLIEIVWALLGLVCLGIAIREISQNGLRGAWLWLIMTVGAFTLAAVRDSQRKKM